MPIHLNPILRADVQIKLDYFKPARTEIEQYHRAHVTNVLNKIAYRFFDNPEEAERLRKHIMTELLLEGHSPDEPIQIRGV